MAQEQAAQNTGNTQDVDLDVRSIPHAQRHTTIFAVLDRLHEGQALVITNDHDPRPLGFQIRALWGDKFSWEYLETGPAVWRVAIRRRAS